MLVSEASVAIPVALEKGGSEKFPSPRRDSAGPSPGLRPARPEKQLRKKFPGPVWDADFDSSQECAACPPQLPAVATPILADSLLRIITDFLFARRHAMAYAPSNDCM